MNFKVTHSLLANNVGANDKVLENFLLALDNLNVLTVPVASSPIFHLRVFSSNLLVLDCLKKILNLFRGSNKVVLPINLSALILKSELLHKQGVGVLSLVRELKSVSSRDMEVDTQVGPLPLSLDND